MWNSQYQYSLSYNPGDGVRNKSESGAVAKTSEHKHYNIRESTPKVSWPWAVKAWRLVTPSDFLWKNDHPRHSSKWFMKIKGEDEAGSHIHTGNQEVLMEEKLSLKLKLWNCSVTETFLLPPNFTQILCLDCQECKGTRPCLLRYLVLQFILLQSRSNPLSKTSPLRTPTAAPWGTPLGPRNDFVSHLTQEKEPLDIEENDAMDIATTHQRTNSNRVYLGSETRDIKEFDSVTRLSSE